MVTPATCRTPAATVIAFLAAVCLLLLICLCPQLPGGVALADEPADDTITADTYDVEETFRIRVDSVGNVRYKDILVYDREFFDAHAASFEEYPFLLSRRYRAMEDVNEIQELQTGMNTDLGSVTLSFSETGRAYNMGDYWILYGFPTEPSSIDGTALTIEETSTVNSDYTLWQDLEFKTTTTVTLPDGAADVRWDQEESAIVWEMPAQLAMLADTGGTPLQRNRAVFIPLFSVLILGALVGGGYVLLRGRREARPAPQAAGATPAQSESVHAGRDATAAAADADAATVDRMASGEAATVIDTGSGAAGGPSVDGEVAPTPRPKYCRHCGAHLEEGVDEQFCTHCGKRIE